jgi:hypothetical protein
MYIIAIGWGFVVILMSAAEAMETSLVAGFLTFFFYGLVPIGLFLYLASTKARRRLRKSSGDS